MIKKLLLVSFVFILILSFSGCGGGGGSKIGTQGTPASIVILPNSASVIFGGGQQKFTAKVFDADGKIVTPAPVLTWSLSDTTYGTVNPTTGVFTSSGVKGETDLTCSCLNGTVSAQAHIIVGEFKSGESQFVNDIQSALISNDELISYRMPVLGEKIHNQLGPGMGVVMGSLEEAFYGFSSFSLMELFGEDLKNYSTWNIPYTDEMGNNWKLTAKRQQSGMNDIVTITVLPNPLAGQIATHLPNYKMSLTYPTILLVKPDFNNGINTISASISLMNKYLRAPATFTGLVEANILKTKYSDVREPLGIHLKGALNFPFKAVPPSTVADYFKFDGDINIQDPLVSGNDHLTGTLETTDLKISGTLQINFAANKFVGPFPSGILLNGTVQSKSTNPIIMSGKLDLQLKNAMTVNPALPYSASNFLRTYFNFDGLIQADTANKLQETITFEEKAFNVYQLVEKTQLTTGGLARNLTFTINTSHPTVSTTLLRCDILSSWGPAFMRLDCKYSSPFIDGPPDTVTGNIYLNKTGPVLPWNGTISLEGGSLVITYKDGTIETL